MECSICLSDLEDSEGFLAKFQIHLAVSLMLIYSVLGQNSTHCCKIILFLSKISEKKTSPLKIYFIKKIQMKRQFLKF